MGVRLTKEKFSTAQIYRLHETNATIVAGRNIVTFMIAQVLPNAWQYRIQQKRSHRDKLMPTSENIQAGISGFIRHITDGFHLSEHTQVSQVHIMSRLSPPPQTYHQDTRIGPFGDRPTPLLYAPSRGHVLERLRHRLPSHGGPKTRLHCALSQRQ